MIKSKTYEIGDIVSFMYPARGKLNTLRNVKGEVVNVGSGPNGDFITVEEDSGQIRSFSVKKIVDM